MRNVILTQELLTVFLQEAEAAHAEYERKLGHRDDNWADWYATFLLPKLQIEQEEDQA